MNQANSFRVLLLSLYHSMILKTIKILDAIGFVGKGRAASGIINLCFFSADYNPVFLGMT
ncbi:MAG TPA: hypothetical protein DCY58_09340 [Acetobacterium sp.]|nr:hypothetical protein [Acetobacterium sp.]